MRQKIYLAIIIHNINKAEPLVRASRTPLDSKYFLKASFFASFSCTDKDNVEHVLQSGGTRRDLNKNNIRNFQHVSENGVSCDDQISVWNVSRTNLSQHLKFQHEFLLFFD